MERGIRGGGCAWVEPLLLGIKNESSIPAGTAIDRKLERSRTLDGSHKCRFENIE